MTQEQIDYVKKCIREDIHRFYVWGPWKKVRREVLQMDHGECQRCKAKKRYNDESYDSASCELCQETSGHGSGDMV